MVAILGDIRLLFQGIGGMTVKLFLRKSNETESRHASRNLQTPLQKNMKDARDKAFVKQLISARRLVETVIGQLSERFHAGDTATLAYFPAFWRDGVFTPS
jgi:hypothetical protein